MGRVGSLSLEAATFLRELKENNNREWFHEHRDRAEELLLAPARQLVYDVGELLRAKRPNIIADPRTDRSIYRLNRDTRFSRDKTPYKTHLALWWWEGFEGRLECPGFYLHFSPDSLGWSVGCYRFSEQGLLNWRKVMQDRKKAASFIRLINGVQKAGLEFNQPELKRMPVGFSLDHPASRWLRHKGLYTWNEEFPHPSPIFSDSAAEYIFSRFEPMLKFHGRLLEILESEAGAGV